MKSDGDHDFDWDEVARVLDESDGCFDIVPDQEIAKPKLSYNLPHPSKCTKQQHVIAAHILRERMAVVTSRRVKQQSEQQASNAIALFRDSDFFCQACENQTGQMRR